MDKILSVIGILLVVVGTIFNLCFIFVRKSDYVEKVAQHGEQEIYLEKNERRVMIIGTALIIIGSMLQIIVLFLTNLNMKFSFVKYIKDFQNNLNDVVNNIIISIVASFIFWFLTFKMSRTKVIFSKKLVKPNDTLTDNRKNYGYRVRYANIGHCDLIEVSVYAKLVIHAHERDHIVFLDVSSTDKGAFVTVLSGFKPHKNKIGKGNYCRTMTLYPSESMQHELSKKKYPQRIRKLAKKGKVQFKDLFDVYDDISITVFVYGNDRTTGARKMFESKPYTKEDIEEGEFYGMKEIAKEIELKILTSRKTKQNLISKIRKIYNV